MNVATCCTREVDFALPQENAWQAAVRMRQRGVGSLVVVTDEHVPVGILTDRDLMERIVAEQRDPLATTVAQIMTDDPTTIRDHESTLKAVALMQTGGFRRLPVVDAQGTLVGLLSLDDLLMRLTDELAHIGQIIRQETPQGIAADATQTRWDF